MPNLVMLLPSNPLDLWPFFWRVPAHRDRRGSPFEMFRLVSDFEADPALLDTLAQAHRRRSALSKKVIDRLSRIMAHRSADLPEHLSDTMMSLMARIDESNLSADGWPEALSGLGQMQAYGSPPPQIVSEVLHQMHDYASMSARCRDALRTGKHQELINLIQDMPFAQSAVATLVLHRLRAANDTAAALPICGLLFPAAVIDLLNRLALEYKVDVFEFAPIRDDAGRIIRPMRRMMDRFHHETAFDRQEDTFRALFWTRGAISEIIKDDDRLPTLLSRGWSYRAVSREDREVPGWKKFGEMIDTISLENPRRFLAQSPHFTL